MLLFTFRAYTYNTGLYSFKHHQAFKNTFGLAVLQLFILTGYKTSTLNHSKFDRNQQTQIVDESLCKSCMSCITFGDVWF